jgi:hypothetical protein
MGSIPRPTLPLTAALLSLSVVVRCTTVPDRTTLLDRAAVADPLDVPAMHTAINLDASAVRKRPAQSLDQRVRNLVLIVAGQSNITDIAPSVYKTRNPDAIDNFNPYDSVIYAAADPLIGCSRNDGGGNPALRLADNLLTAKRFDRVIIAPIAVDGTTIADWSDGFAASRVSVTLTRLADIGIVEGRNITIAVIFGQGEQDLGTSREDYLFRLRKLIASSRAVGFRGPWFIAKQTYSGGRISTAVQSAQTDVVDHQKNIWAGVDADSLNGSVCGGKACRQAPGDVHWSDAGSQAYAAGWQKVLDALGPLS